VKWVRNSQLSIRASRLVSAWTASSVPIPASRGCWRAWRFSSLHGGVTVPRGARLSMQLNKGERTACEFRTAHETVLWPLCVGEARYISGTGSLAALGVVVDERTRAAIDADAENKCFVKVFS
jgi:hypothetical protein